MFGKSVKPSSEGFMPTVWQCLNKLMMNQDIQNWLLNRFGASVAFAEPMSRHTSFRVGGPADAWVLVESLDQLRQLVTFCRQKELKIYFLGKGTNLLVRDGGIRGIVVQLGGQFKSIEVVKEDSQSVWLSAGSGTSLQVLCRYAIKRGLAGLNFALGIPGSVGGAIKGNAGTRWGSVGDAIEQVTLLKSAAEPITIPRDKLDFRYRQLRIHHHNGNCACFGPVILEALFRLSHGDADQLVQEADAILMQRHRAQPTRAPNAGCFFKNPSSGEPAGKLIELTGLKGKTIGGAMVSPKHANFVVNFNQASAADIVALKNMIQETVLKRFNIKLETEVEIVGEKTRS
jgi:UDP-N-acetylmuramate dehydrogenase